MSKKITELTETTSLDNANDWLVVVDVSDTTQSASGTNKKIKPSNLGLGGATTDTGTTITFTQDTVYNGATYLTSGNLTLDLTGAVTGVVAICYCNGYAPTISGGDYIIGSGSLDANSLNILSFLYDGSNIYLNVANVSTLTAPTLVLTAGDTEMQVDWSAITNADNYVIEMADDSGFTTNLVEIYNGALLTVTRTGLTNGQTYYFRGKSQGTGYIESAWSATVSDAPAVVNPYLANLVAAYNFDSNSSDYTTNNDGTDSNMSYANTGKISNCATFNGSSSGIEITDSNDFSFTDGAGNDEAFSISFWVYFDDFTGTNEIIEKFLAGGSGNEWLINRNTTTLNFLLYSGGATSARIGKTYDMSALSTSTWYHFVLTYDGSEADTGMNIYRDGSLVTMGTSNAGSYTGMNNTTEEVRIGTRNGSSNFLAGRIDALYVWKGRELTSGEANDIYTTENGGAAALP